MASGVGTNPTGKIVEVVEQVQSGSTNQSPTAAAVTLVAAVATEISPGVVTKVADAASSVAGPAQVISTITAEVFKDSPPAVQEGAKWGPVIVGGVLTATEGPASIVALIGMEVGVWKRKEMPFWRGSKKSL